MTEAKLNIQGLARRDKGLGGMPGLCTYIRPAEGRTFIGQDLNSAEPTVTAHYSQDSLYRYATLEGIGKEPYFSEKGILMIDDVYIMFMSNTTHGGAIVREAFNKDWDGLTFPQQWLKKSKVIKEYLESSRQYYKMIALALLYGMGPKKVQTQSYEQFSVELSQQEALSIWQGYWSAFSGVKALSDRLQQKARHGWIENIFGYRITFDTSGVKGKDTTHKACNYLIQSTVSGIMHLYTNLMNKNCLKRGLPFDFITVIHDELVLEVDTDKVDSYKAAQQESIDEMNKLINWTVPVLVGFSVGESFYHIK